MLSTLSSLSSLSALSLLTSDVDPAAATAASPVEGLFGEHDDVVVEDVVGVELTDVQAVHVGEVAEALPSVDVVVSEDDKHLALGANGSEGGDGVSGLGRLELPLVDDDHVAVRRSVRQGEARASLIIFLGVFWP